MTTTITVFRDQYATSQSMQTHRLEDLAELIKNTQKTEKKLLPWLKMARFGNIPSSHNSLRHDANVIEVTGCEADYDDGVMSFDEAVERLEKAGLEAIVYTSPSHEPDRPRWRVLAPFSQPLTPDAREHMLRRLNGVLGGVIADESFTLSQSYYFGHLYEAAEFRAETIRGMRIDKCDELDASAIGKSGKEKPKSGNGEDPDPQFYDEGLDVVEMIRRVETGESLHPPMMRLAGKLGRELKSKQLITEILRGIFLSANQGRYAGRWPEILREINYVIDKEAAKQNMPPMPAAQVALRIDVSAWENKPVPEQQWTVQNRFPRGEIALLSGPGAVGKSLIALHLCVATALGRDWLGAMPEQGSTMFIEAEDRAAVLWRRTEALRRHYGASYTELHNAGLHLFSLHAQNAIMATVSKNSLVTPTDLFNFFRSYALDIKPQLVVLPATANIFAGNENDRSQVSQFIHLLGALADDIDGTVLLITHPSLSGNSRSNGNDHFGLSGSTAWHNGPRARAVLSTAKDNDAAGDAGGPNDARKLEFFKNQYGIAEETITLRFADGMLKPENSGTPYENAARNTIVDAAFMRAFMYLTTSGTTVGADRGSRNHPSALFAQEAEIKAAKISKRELINATMRLIDNGTLRVETYGPPSNQHKKLVVP